MPLRPHGRDGYMTRQGNGACGWRLLACAAAAAATPHRKLTAFIVDPREAQLYDAVARARRALDAAIPIVAFTRRGKNWTKSFDVSRLGNVVARRTKVADKHAYNKELRSPKFWRALNVTYALLFEADVTFDSKPSDPLASFVDALERGVYIGL